MLLGISKASSGRVVDTPRPRAPRPLHDPQKENTMTLRRAKVGLALLASLGFLALVSLAPAEPTKPEGPAPEDRQVVSSKSVPRPTASSVNFRKSLGLPFPTLNTLGSRIDTARRASDPVALAHAASELSVAEKVSGKKASLTSTILMNEAAQLAALRRQEAELNAVLEVSKQVETTEDNIALLKTQIQQAKNEAREARRSIERNEEPTAATRRVIVNNYTTQYIDVYVNGFFRAHLLPGAGQVITIEHRWNPTVLTAYGNEDIDTWGPRYIWGRFDKYTWNIN
jgi:hypothetical protein